MSRRRIALILKLLVAGGLFWWLIAAGLGAIVVWGAIAYAYQLIGGLGVTGLSQRVTWGFYIANLVFFIGISYGGALTSAILRLTGAPWRAPLTRMAEATAVAALLVGAAFPLIDLGRPDLLSRARVERDEYSFGCREVDLVAVEPDAAVGVVKLHERHQRGDHGQGGGQDKGSDKLAAHGAVPGTVIGRRRELLCARHVGPGQ